MRTQTLPTLPEIHTRVITCERCPRLRRHCQEIAQEKRRAFLDQDYWGRPVSGFGDPAARVVIVGLAPAAHGANRTGRMFTGDRSGEWLYRALHKAGFANQPQSVDREDGLKLRDAYITAVARCAPPDNKPKPDEIENCAPYLEQELQALKNAQIYIALGQIALAGLWPKLSPEAPRPKFAHAHTVEVPGGKWLILSYHPSQQNTFTGRLTEPMFDRVFELANQRLRFRR